MDLWLFTNFVYHWRKAVGTWPHPAGRYVPGNYLLAEGGQEPSGQRSATSRTRLLYQTPYWCYSDHSSTNKEQLPITYFVEYLPQVSKMQHKQTWYKIKVSTNYSIFAILLSAFKKASVRQVACFICDGIKETFTMICNPHRGRGEGDTGIKGEGRSGIGRHMNNLLCS